MNHELDQALCEKFPKIFAERDSSRLITAMCWGFEVEDGWYSLIDVLCEQLQWETDEQGAPQVVATQVKEKCGGLRFYVRNATDRQRAMIDFAKALSYRTCEVCGALTNDSKSATPHLSSNPSHHCDGRYLASR